MENDVALAELQAGVAELRAGQMERARSRFQRAVELAPDNADAWHLLGASELKLDRAAVAIEHFRECLRRRPSHAEAACCLGVALRQSGRHGESIAAFTAAMAARPRFAEAAANLGASLEATGDDAGAERLYRDALEWRAGDIGTLTRLGRLLCRLARQPEALAHLEAAQRLAPQLAQTNGNLAMALLDVGRPSDAEGYAQNAVTHAPAVGFWWRTLGVAQRLQRRNEDAIASLRKAVELLPGDDVAAAELGVALADFGLVAEARTTLAQAAALGRNDERLRWTKALSLPSVYLDEAQVDAERSRFARSLDEIDSALRLDTEQRRAEAYDALSSTGTYLLHYQARNNTALQNRFGDLAARVMSARAPRLAQPCTWRVRANGGRTRVGVVSSHLMHHTVSRYFRSMILGLDPGRFDVHVWYSGGKRDFSTGQIAQQVSGFEYTDADPLELAARIRALELDVLIYPEIGMDPRHHVLGALRLAPVQCVLYGHPATSGLANVDFFLSGEALEPAEAAEHYRERLVLMPGLGARPEAPPPAGDGTWVDEFAGATPLILCLQNQLKLTPAFDGALAKIARRTGARIGFFFRNNGIGRLFRARIEAAFRREGIEPDRALLFLPSKSHEMFLGAIQRAAFVLDPPGFSGGATSLDAFSTGTPVLAWEGDMARGRQTAAMLRLIGAGELVAHDADAYVEQAVALHADEGLRASLRARIGANARILFEDDRPVRSFADFIAAVE
jgi:predicted O-linked N-acetylglucosamine transferase (SPINDLY family)